MVAATLWPVESEADVEDRVRLALRELDAQKELQFLLIGLLEQPGRLFGPTEPQWPKFVLETCKALGGDVRSASWAAAAVEFAVAAIDCADDLADGDLAHDHEATIRAPGAALALGWLAQHCCARGSEELGMGRAQRIALLLATGSLASCAGQDLDMLLESASNVTEEQSAAVSWRKSGALAAMACTIGAACATDSVEIIELAGRFGAHAGMVAQLVNDIDGVLKSEQHVGKDILRRKKTLPVAYALSCAREEGIVDLLAWYERPSLADSEAGSAVARIIRDLGALHYTWAVADVHVKRAQEALRFLERITGSRAVRSLDRLLPELTSN